MNTLPVRLALGLLGVNILGAIAAVVLDLPARFVIGPVQNADIGAEVIWEGSATSGPWPPLVALIIAVLLASRLGKPRVAGLVLFLLTGVVMVIGVIGEFVEGTAFTGIDQVAFLVFSAALFGFAAALAVASVRALVLRSWRVETS